MRPYLHVFDTQSDETVLVVSFTQKEIALSSFGSAMFEGRVAAITREHLQRIIQMIHHPARVWEDIIIHV